MLFLSLQLLFSSTGGVRILFGSLNVMDLLLICCGGHLSSIQGAVNFSSLVVVVFYFSLCRVVLS